MNRSLPEAMGPVVTAAETAVGLRGLISDLVILTKARLTTMVMITTFIGSCMASVQSLDWLLLINTLLGTALVAASSQVLNQVIEAEADLYMERTRNRPLPAGRMRRTSAALFGFVMGILGVFYLALTVNALTAYLSAATIVIYLLLYTPLKKRTPFCITIGAVAGAIPPVIGWTAVRNSLDWGAWILFGVLFFWQMPHFLAIAWMYKDEYKRACFVMLRPKDVSGSVTALESFAFSIALTLVCIAPVFVGMTASWYLVAALLCSTPMVVLAARFLSERSYANARSLFLASLLFLPVQLTLMVVSKL